jgi:nitrite reductase/ring-hydroxylating ferredoxin subunit
MAQEIEVGPASELVPGVVRGADRYAVENANGQFFAVTRRCRHMGADLAKGPVDQEGCLVCQWHGARYNVATGRMTRGPQGFFATVPGPRCWLPATDEGAATGSRRARRARRHLVRPIAPRSSRTSASSVRGRRSGRCGAPNRIDNGAVITHRDRAGQPTTTGERRGRPPPPTANRRRILVDGE